MKAEQAKRGVSKGSPYLSTHPADDDRIAKQEEWMDAAVQVTSLAPGGSRFHILNSMFKL